MHTLIDLDTVDSTNSWAKKNIATFRDDVPTVITAREQTNGRGRFGRPWLSPHGQNLYLTIVEKIRPPLQLIHYSQATALAIAKALQAYTITAQIKWPNDLLVDGKKICGILVEEASKGKDSWVIVGIGLNVNMDPVHLESIDRLATSLQQLLDSPVTIEEVRHIIVDSVLSFFAWAKENPDQCQKQYLDTCLPIKN